MSVVDFAYGPSPLTVLLPVGLALLLERVGFGESTAVLLAVGVELLGAFGIGAVMLRRSRGGIRRRRLVVTVLPILAILLMNALTNLLVGGFLIGSP